MGGISAALHLGGLIRSDVGGGFKQHFVRFFGIPIFSTLSVVYAYFLAKIVGLEPFPGEDTPSGPAKGFMSQLILDVNEVIVAALPD